VDTCLACTGVPREKRGEIWLLLVEQHRLHHDVAAEAEVSEKYEDLLKRLTLHQHAILIDLGVYSLTRYNRFDLP